MNHTQTNFVKYKELSNKIKCPKCSGSSFWKTGDNRLKCKNCRHIFTLKPNPLNIPNEILNEVISEFLLGHSTNIILERVNISKYKLLKVLTLLRILMARDIPDALRGIMKLDKDYLEGRLDFKLDNKIKHPIIGILCKEEKVYAKILSNIKAQDLKLFLKTQEKKESISYSEEWQKYVGLAFKGRFYRVVLPENKKYRIDALETFWGYLKRKLSAKGGIRKEKLPLYLGEYAWRYNHRKLLFQEQEKHLSSLVKQKLV